MERISETQHTDSFVDLATEAVHTFVKSGRKLSAPKPTPSEMRGKAGVFVSIKKSGQLRGCIGTFFPTEETIAHEVIANAIKSASADHRFSPITEPELACLTISVDVLSEPEPCDEIRLDPSRFGVIVESGWRRGLLLPDLEGVDTVADQVAIAKNKAGIREGEPVSLFRFTVERHQ
ncbi:AmmeMemoRadiSam system protein A [Candidatus Bipolaricaulota bacterium]|nr:AmmeMemoRadiSam system protein A [Candidatus Bipolaricaulota bacterium]